MRSTPSTIPQYSTSAATGSLLQRDDRPRQPTFTPETVGFPSYLTAASQYPQLPFITPGYTSLGFQSASKDPSTIYGLFGDVVKIIGRDTLKFGVDARQYRVDVTNYGAAAGTFTFASNFVQPGSSGSAPTFGGPEASFLMGPPISGSFFNAATANFHAIYLAFFVQNDWRITDHITVNLGVRYDHESPFEDKLSRVVNGSIRPRSAVYPQQHRLPMRQPPSARSRPAPSTR